MAAKGKAPRPWNAGKIALIVVVVALLAYGAGSIAYVSAFGVERDSGTVVVAVAAGLEADAACLAEGFAAAGDGRRVVLIDSAGNELPAAGAGSVGAASVSDEGLALAGLLKDGLADFVLVTGDQADALGAALLPADSVAFRHADLLAVPFPSVEQAVSLEQAQSLVQELRGAGAGAASGSGAAPAGIELLSLGDRSPDKQLLKVGDVYPTLDTVQDGSYPLVTDVRVAARKPGGFWASILKIGFVREMAQANAAVVDDFAAWLASDDARVAFYGTSKEITLAAVGDVMLGRKTGRMMDIYGIDWLLREVSAQLSSADITYGNMEAPLGTTGTMIPGKEIWLRGRPEYVQALKQAGFDVMNLANNHILDYDSPCMIETIDILDQNGIAHCGGGKNIAAAREPAIIEAGGLKVAFLGYSEFSDPGLFWSFSYRRTFLASETEPGCNPLDMTIIAEDIAKAKTMADVVVVCYHWGQEGVDYPQAWCPWTPRDLEVVARQTIDLGADLILGGHPHCQQGYEVYNGGLICYSLGNFANDMAKVIEKEAVIVEFQIGQSGVLSTRITPCWIEDTTNPRYMKGAEAEALFEKIVEVSARFKH